MDVMFLGDSILCLCPCSSSSSGTSLRRNHPWLTIIHPGPWMHLPAAPPPAPLPLWHRPRAAAPNPFERVDEKAKPQKAAANQSDKGAGGGGASIRGATAPEEPGRRRDEAITGDVHDAGAAEARARVAPSEQLPRSLSVSAPTSATCSVPPPERPEVKITTVLSVSIRPQTSELICLPCVVVLQGGSV